MWTEELLSRDRFYLIGFVANVKNEKLEENLRPSSIKNNLLSIQRAIQQDWKCDIGFLRGRWFADETDGVVAFLDNGILHLQLNGMPSKSHNVISILDISKLYVSDSLSKGAVTDIFELNGV